MARISDDLHAGGPAQGTGPKILNPDHGQVGVPSDAFITHGDLIRDGQDLILKADGQSLVIKGYFSADPHPTIHAPSGATLTPDLVQSFAHHEGPVQYAADAKANDASPVGIVKEVHGHGTIHHTDGTTETIIVGTAVHEGDVIETDAEGAVNILFRDNSSFAVSHNAKLAIDEYVFDPHSDAGASNFSMLRGMFVYTSGLIGHQDPDDVHIHTPAGSIGIRGTVIMGNVDTGQVTVVEGAIVLTSNNGEEMTLSSQYETAQFDTSTGHITNEGTQSASDLSTDYSSLSSVAPALFSGFDATGTTTPDSTTPDGSNTTAPDSTTPATSPTDGDHSQTTAPDGTATTTAATDTSTDTTSTDLGTVTFDTTGTTTGDTFGDTGAFTTTGSDTFVDTGGSSTLLDSSGGSSGAATGTGTSGSTAGSGASSSAPPAGSTAPPVGSTFADQLPVAGADTILPSPDQNTSVAMGAFSVLTNDTDADPLDTLSVTAGSFAGSNGGTFTLDAAGHVGFNPGTDFINLGFGASRTSSYSYTVTDSQGGQSLGTVSITVNGLNDAPTAMNVLQFSSQNGTLPGNMLLSDIEPDIGDTLTVTAVNGLAGNVGIAVAGTNGGLFTLQSDGTYLFDTNGAFTSLGVGATLDTSFTYDIVDSQGASGGTATVTVRVSGANDGPTANNEAGATGENTLFTGMNVLANDTDPDAGDVLSVTALTNVAGSGGGLFTIDAAGNLTFDPGLAFNSLDVGATATSSINYVINDGHGGTSTGTATITINGANDAPVAVADTVGTNPALGVTENASIVSGVNVLGNDSDPDSLDTFSISAVAGSGTNIGVGVAGSNGGTFIIDALGNLTFNPGTAFDILGQGASTTTSVSYTIVDSHGQTSIASATVTVTGTNDVPTLVISTTGVNQGQAVVLNTGMLNVTDPDATAAMLTFTVTSLPAHGAIYLGVTQLGIGNTFTLQDVINGSVKYVNDGNLFAADSFNYNLSDGLAGFSNTLSIVITAVPPLDLNTITGPQGFTVTDNINQAFGGSVSGGHDLNGDGFDDLLFVKSNSPIGSDLYFRLGGQAGPIANQTVGGSLPGLTAGFTTVQTVSNLKIASIGNFGTIVGQEFAVAAPNATTGSPNSGEIQILDAAGTVQYTITNLLSPLALGTSMAGVGDVNGDGYDDLLLGSPIGAVGPANSGSIYLVYGGQATGVIDLNAVSATEGMRFDSGVAGAFMGKNVSSAGDFNDDGYLDIMTSLAGSGKAAIYLGGPSLGSAPIQINGVGATGGDIPVMSLGDVNGDGISDVGILSHTANSNSGELVVYFGGSSHTAGQTLNFAAPNFAVNGTAGSILSSAGSVGDFNGDGINDIGLVTHDAGNTVADIYVFFGRSGLTGTTNTGAPLNNTQLDFHMTYSLTNIVAGGADKITISSAGDLNGDGFGDVVIGIPSFDGNGDLSADGSAIIVYGTQAGLNQVVTDGGPGDGSPTPNIVTATANSQSLVATSSSDSLDDGSFTNISFSAGAGNDVIDIHNGAFHTINGGGGDDIINFMQTGGSLNFTGLNSEQVSHIETINMQSTGQSLTLNLNNIFHLMETSDLAKLSINSTGSTANTLTIDNQGAGSGAGVSAAALDTLLGTSAPNTINGGYTDFHFGNHTLAIETNLISGAHVNVV